MLCLPGPENAYRYDGDFKISGIPIYVQQEGGEGRGTAWCVWDGAAVLARYIDLCGYNIFRRESSQGNDPPLTVPLYCIELGSGTGLGGLSVAQRFQIPVALTDIQEALPALHNNVNLNPNLKHLAFPMVLDWTAPDVPTVFKLLDHALAMRVDVPSVSCGANSNDSALKATSLPASLSASILSISTPKTGLLQVPSGIQHEKAAHVVRGAVLILASDCVWVQTLVEPFVTTLIQVCHACEGAVVLLAHKHRSKYVDKFLFDRLSQTFEVEHISPLPGEWRGSTEVLKLVPFPAT